MIIRQRHTRSHTSTRVLLAPRFQIKRRFAPPAPSKKNAHSSFWADVMSSWFSCSEVIDSLCFWFFWGFFFCYLSERNKKTWTNTHTKVNEPTRVPLLCINLPTLTALRSLIAVTQPTRTTPLNHSEEERAREGISSCW